MTEVVVNTPERIFPISHVVKEVEQSDRTTNFVPRKRKEVAADVVIKMHCSFNNTIISIVRGGITLIVKSAGFEFKNTKKGTAWAARRTLDVAMDAASAAFKSKFKRVMRWVDLEVKGPSQGWDQVALSLKNKGVEVLTIRDTTGIPHNGCRPRKKRRV